MPGATVSHVLQDACFSKSENSPATGTFPLHMTHRCVNGADVHATSGNIRTGSATDRRGGGGGELEHRSRQACACVHARTRGASRNSRRPGCPRRVCRKSVLTRRVLGGVSATTVPPLGS
ncbi:unnamed protein product [Mesocestoides corti]|uniref:Uncharacterized protein n=1 Tax=Mesocestoides corti TaxID=53468 RepID=A0A0R3UFE9_MESCO|nr:unnamed protein product [Mesocestoides corti]